jgi:hypothetical protein
MDHQLRGTQNQVKLLLIKEFARLDESRSYPTLILIEKSGRISFNDFLRVMEEQSQKFAEPKQT